MCGIDGNVKLKTLVESLDHGNPQFNPGDYVAKITLSTYPVSTCTAERSFRSMKRLKTPLRSTMTDGRLSSIAILHIHKRKDVKGFKFTTSRHNNTSCSFDQIKSDHSQTKSTLFSNSQVLLMLMNYWPWLMVCSVLLSAKNNLF